MLYQGEQAVQSEINNETERYMIVKIESGYTVRDREHPYAQFDIMSTEEEVKRYRNSLKNREIKAKTKKNSLKNREIKEKTEKKVYKIRRITAQERAEGIIWLHDFVPKNKKQKRDKVILEYYLIDNLCGQAIQTLNDPRIISFSNRNYGEMLTESSILQIVYQYFPQFRNRIIRRPGDLRIQHKRLVEKKLIKHIEKCAFCGTRENLESHHMIPLFLGGTNDERNLVFLCKSCHKGVTAYQRSFMNKKEQ